MKMRYLSRLLAHASGQTHLKCAVEIPMPLPGNPVSRGQKWLKHRLTSNPKGIWEQ